MTHQPENISAGTQVVALAEIRGPNSSLVHPRGAVGVVTRTPCGEEKQFLVRFPDGFEKSLSREQIEVLKHFKDRLGSCGDGLSSTVGHSGSVGPCGSLGHSGSEFDLERLIIYRCVMGSQAYGLSTDDSDTDRRGIYLAPAELQWSLFGAPEQFEDNAAQAVYWELQKFIIMALRANPNILECLYSPIVEKTTPLADELLALREQFLSQMIFQTFNGYALSQFKKIEQDLRNQGEVRWKHAMHLLRLLITGAATLREMRVPVRVEAHRERLLAVKQGVLPWSEVVAWRRDLHRDFEIALTETNLPERPDYEAANRFLIKARRQIAGTHQQSRGLDITLRYGTVTEPRDSVPNAAEGPGLDPRLQRIVSAQPYPLLFATISGAHLYGFPSPDSDFDLRGAHVLPVEEVVGLEVQHETVQDSRIIESLEMDIVTHDVRKFFKLLLKKNGYVLEQLFSPLVVRTTPEHEELKHISRHGTNQGVITKHHAHHYFGFAETEWKLFLKETPRRVKPLLYVYRVLLTGIHLMRTGEVEANILNLNEEMKLPFIPELVARKIAGPEQSTLNDADLSFHETQYQKLRTELQTAYEASSLPELPGEETRRALGDLLVRVRQSS